MKHRLAATLTAIIIFITYFVGCGKTSAKVDLQNYLKNELPKVYELEARAVDKYSSVSGANYTNDKDMYEVIKTSVIPSYKTFKDKLESIKPKSKEVAQIHKIYILAANNQLKAFNEIATALENQDITLINEANSKLTAARNGIEDYKDKILDLCDKYEVEPLWK